MKNTRRSGNRRDFRVGGNFYTHGESYLAAEDVYVGAEKVINANGTLVNAASVENGSITALKLASDAVTTVKILNANVTAAKLAADAVETAKILNSNVTIPKLSNGARDRVLTYQVEDLDAGDDIANRSIFFVPAEHDILLLSAKILSQGTPAGIDAGNKCVIKIDDGTNEIVEKEYDDGTAFPADGNIGDLGALDGDYTSLAAGEKIRLSVTNGATANPPGFMLQISYRISDPS